MVAKRDFEKVNSGDNPAPPNRIAARSPEPMIGIFYSLFHKDKYVTDENYICGGYEDTDLAAHFVITYNRGIVLFGKEIKEAFNPIDKKYYIDSIKLDINEAVEGFFDKPVYYVLNLSRVLLYLRGFRHFI